MQFKKFYLERVVMGVSSFRPPQADRSGISVLSFLEIFVDCFCKIEEVCKADQNKNGINNGNKNSS